MDLVIIRLTFKWSCFHIYSIWGFFLVEAVRSVSSLDVFKFVLFQILSGTSLIPTPGRMVRPYSRTHVGSTFTGIWPPGWLHSKHCTNIHFVYCEGGVTHVQCLSGDLGSGKLCFWICRTMCTGNVVCFFDDWYMILDHRIIRSWHVFIWTHEYCGRSCGKIFYFALHVLRWRETSFELMYCEFVRLIIRRFGKERNQWCFFAPCRNSLYDTPWGIWENFKS